MSGSGLRVATVMLICFVGLCGVGYGKEKKESQALSIVRAAGFKEIQDVSAKRREALNFKKLSSDGPLGLKVGYPEVSPRFLIWLPRSEVSSGTAAVEMTTQAIVDGVVKTLPGYEARVSERAEHPRKVVEITGGDCRPCTFASWVFNNAPREKKAPDVLGGYEAYVWGGFNGTGVGTISGYPLGEPKLTNEARVEFFRRLSVHLPGWIYVYLPPDARLKDYPQVLHQGKELLFVEPGFEIRQRW